MEDTKHLLTLDFLKCTNVRQRKSKSTEIECCYSYKPHHQKIWTCTTSTIVTNLD